MTLLRVAGLAKRYGGVDAVRGVSFDLGATETLAIIGPNGAGKSTCFNMVGGQVRPDAGSVHLDRQDVTGASARALFRAGVGRTFQIATVFHSMTVLETVQTAILSRERRTLSLFRNARAMARAESTDLLAALDLSALADTPCRQLAYGDLKRVELALALSGNPRLLLLDEPTAGMAAAERIAMMHLVRDAARDRGIGILFTEHDMDVVFGFAERIIVLNRGEIIAEGKPEDIRRDPAVAAVYLGEGGP